MTFKNIDKMTDDELKAECDDCNVGRCGDPANPCLIYEEMKRRAYCKKMSKLQIDFEEYFKTLSRDDKTEVIERLQNVLFKSTFNL